MNPISPRKPRRRMLRRLTFALPFVLTISYFTVSMAARLFPENHLIAAPRCDVGVRSVRAGWVKAFVRDIRLSAVGAPGEPFVNVPEVIVTNSTLTLKRLPRNPVSY